MKVKKVYLKNYLSYESLFVEFADGLNIIVGNNATGKTNLLDSIYYSSIGKSSKGLKDKELINWDAKETENARIRLFVETRNNTHIVDIQINRLGKKRITIDDMPITKIGELMGVIQVVYFSPDEMKLIKESPQDRRRFMDISLSQQDRLYFYSLVQYNQLLEQRNKLLKDYYNSDNLKDMSTIITDKMADTEMYIIRKRKEFIDSISPIANKCHEIITGGKEDLKICYETSGNIDYNDINGSLKKIYQATFEKDCKLQYTTVGVHRDDIKIEAGGIDVRKFGSQGQKRTAVLSLKLAEIERFHMVTKEYPVVLLDDVLSELDEDRRTEFFKLLKDVQTFVTCTEYGNELGDNKTIYRIKDKKVTKQ